MKTEIRLVIEPEYAPEDLMRAAGGVVLRTGRSGVLEVALIHRPHREDWSLPKGKLDEGETYEECAVREVFEETGLTCRLESYIGLTEYTHRKGRPKIVAYWLMSVISGEFVANDEADELRWCTLEEALKLATYDRDQEFLALIPTLPHAGHVA